MGRSACMPDLSTCFLPKHVLCHGPSLNGARKVWKSWLSFAK